MRCQWRVFGVLSQNTGFYPSLDRIVETTRRPLNLGPGGGSYNEPISHLQCALEEWRHFLEGSDQKFKIHTDHKNLSYFQEAHKLNCHQAQWSLYLSRFDFILTHKPRRQMGRPDALLRWVDHPRGADDNRLHPADPRGV